MAELTIDTPVRTRDGRKARILCVDLKGRDKTIAAAITCADGTEALYTYPPDGVYMPGLARDSDLIPYTPLVVEVGNAYRTRSGAVAVITNDNVGGDLYGWVAGCTRQRIWARDGANISNDADDLIEPVQ